MRMRCGRALMVGLLVAGLLSACAATVAQNTGGLSTAENPEYLAHPFRLVALGLYFTGNVLRYAVVEPFYFAMNTVPDAVGLEPDEQQYLKDRQEAWAHWMEPRPEAWERLTPK